MSPSRYQYVFVATTIRIRLRSYDETVLSLLLSYTAPDWYCLYRLLLLLLTHSFVVAIEELFTFHNYKDNDDNNTIFLYIFRLQNDDDGKAQWVVFPMGKPDNCSTAVLSRLSSTALLLLVHRSYSITSRRQADKVKETALEQTTTAAFDGTETITVSSFIFRLIVLYSLVRWLVWMMAFSFTRYNSSSTFPIITHSNKSLFSFERVAIIKIPFPLHTLIHQSSYFLRRKRHLTLLLLRA